MKIKVFQIRIDGGHLQNDQEELNNFLATITIKKTAVAMVEDKISYWSVVIFYTEEKPELKTKSDKIFFPTDTILTEEENKIYSTLKDWRLDKANAQKLPTYVISSNTELLTIAKVKPQTVNDLIKIKGFAAQKIAKYGEDIIALLNSV